MKHKAKLISMLLILITAITLTSSALAGTNIGSGYTYTQSASGTGAVHVTFSYAIRPVSASAFATYTVKCQVYNTRHGAWETVYTTTVSMDPNGSSRGGAFGSHYTDTGRYINKARVVITPNSSFIASGYEAECSLKFLYL